MPRQRAHPESELVSTETKASFPENGASMEVRRVEAEECVDGEGRVFWRFGETQLNHQ